MGSTLTQEMDFSDIDRFLETVFQTGHITFETLLDELMKGNLDGFGTLFLQYLKDVFFGNLEQCRSLFLGIFLLGIFALLLNGLSDWFSDGKITMFSGYFIFLFVSLLLMKCFLISYEQSLTCLNEMKSFCGMLMPVFCMVLGISGGPVTAAAYYELQLFLLYIIEYVMTAVAMPLIQIMCVLYVLNQLPEGNRFGGVLSLMKKTVLFLTKSAIFATVGASVLQAGLMPAIDGEQSKFVLKTVSLIPGLGDYAGAITETILRGAILVKNSIGAAGILILMLMCFRPALTTLMYGAVVRLASAVLQISGEKRFTDHVWKMADCFFLLARVQLYASGMFFIAISAAALGMNSR